MKLTSRILTSVLLTASCAGAVSADDALPSEETRWPLTFLGRYPTGPGQTVAVEGGLVLFNQGPSLWIADYSSPANPVDLGHLALGSAYDVTAIETGGGYAYVAADGLNVIDLADPSHPVLVEQWLAYPRVRDLKVAGSYAYLVTYNPPGVAIVDISDPANPSQLGFHASTVQINPASIDVEGPYAYLACGGGGLRVLDVSDPAAPVEVGIYSNGSVFWELDVHGEVAYLASSDLLMVDVSDPALPTLIGQYAPPDYCPLVRVAGTYAYVYSDYSPNYLEILDVSDPSAPEVVGACSVPDLGSEIQVSNGHVFLACRSYGARNGLEAAAAIAP